MVFSLAALYNLKGTPLLCEQRTSGVDKYSFIFPNASCYLPPCKFKFIFQLEYRGKGISFPNTLPIILLK
jgi:hypothetical protein